MSISPFFYIEKYNYEEDKWEKVTIYTKDKKGEFKEVDLWPWNGTHDLFGALGYERDGEYEFPYMHYGLPGNCSEEMKEIYKSHCWEESDGFNYKPDVMWFNCADAEIFVKNYPKFINYEAMDETWSKEELEWGDVEKEYMDNPVKDFLERVNTYVEMEDDIYGTAPSDIRIIGWVSW